MALRGARSLPLCGLLLAAVVLAGCGEESAEPTSGSAETASETGTPEPTSEPSESAETAEPAEPTTEPVPPPPGTPACDEVWQDGATLPRGYAGCAETGDAGDALIEPDTLGCSSGQAIVRYADRFWAFAGGEVTATEQSLMRDRDYRAATIRCSA